MNTENDPRFAKFLEAVRATRLHPEGDAIALHHSAVEVSNWDEIQAALRQSEGGSGLNEKAGSTKSDQ